MKLKTKLYYKDICKIKEMLIPHANRNMLYIVPTVCVNVDICT
jgi:hypothetical protein